MLIRDRLSVVLLALVLAACASTEKDPTAGWSVEKLYAEARDEQANLQYEKAAKLFEKLEGRAAGTPLAQQAQLESNQYLKAELAADEIKSKPFEYDTLADNKLEDLKAVKQHRQKIGRAHV